MFIDICAGMAGSGDWTLDMLINELLRLSELGLFEDDCTLVRLQID